MVKEKIQFRKYLTDIATLIASFLDGNIREADRNIENNDFQTYEIVTKEIFTLFEIWLGYTTIITLEEKVLIESCQADFSMFYSEIVERYYKNYKKELPGGIFESKIKNAADAIINGDKQKLTANDQVGYDEYKAVLFEILEIFKENFEKVFYQNQTYDPVANGLSIILDDTHLKGFDNYKPIYNKRMLRDLYFLLLDGNVIKSMSSYEAFIACFDFNKIPIEKPELEYVKLFVFAMYCFDINSKIALTNFGLTNWDQRKSKIRNEIEEVDSDASIVFTGKNRKLASSIEGLIEKMKSLG